MSEYAADLASVQAAARRIERVIHRTPVMRCATIDVIAGHSLYFKCEQFQKVGAFKFRGASNAVLQLDEETAARGVVTHSSGNHAQALALAARMRGIDAHIVMPRTAPKVKRRAVEGYGAHVIECEPTQEDRTRTAEQVQRETSATLIPPYDHPHIIAGQGTAALELLEECPQIDTIVAPVGGGGLIGGCCAVAAAWMTPVRVIAAEPAGADDAARSKTSGQLLPQTAPRTIADGLLTSLGQLSWPFVRDVVERVVTVTDEQIVAAMRLLLERAKLLVEPSSAVALAAVISLAEQQRANMQHVGIILSGGNVDLDQLPW